jgi:dihydropyrimidine dehydrogenase (NAD+) subunit PreA
MSNSKYKEILLTEEAGGCLLCNSAPCSKACPYGVEADRIIRSIRFENYSGARAGLSCELPCFTCESKACMEACLKGRINRPVLIDEIMQKLTMYEEAQVKDIDLSIKFCGVKCENPFFLSSSIVGSNYEMVAKAFDMGWAGVAFKTIGMFVPDEVSPRFDAIRKEAVPFVGFKNIEQISDHTLSENVYYIKKLKKNYPEKVIIASIMGRNESEWTYLAELMTEAGADIIECNFSCPHMAEDGVGSDVGQNPELVASYTKAVRRGTQLPVLAKMTPNLGNMQIPALAAVEAGATGIAAINTIKSVMNIDLKSFVSGPDVTGKSSVGGYSGKAVKPIALYFIHSLKSCDRLEEVPFSGMGGIENWRDAAEFLALGCENIQITTSVMQYGYRIIDDLIEGMKYYLADNGYSGVSDIIGKALPNIISTDDLERSSICYPRFDRSKCIGCGRCCISCYDGGHQALRQNIENGAPVMDANKCVGCQLCAIICPAQAISQGVRVSKKSREEIAI